jgi:hypothetical protein
LAVQRERLDNSAHAVAVASGKDNPKFIAFPFAGSLVNKKKEPSARLDVILRVSRDFAIGFSLTTLWIPIGAVLFVVALTVSAVVVPQLRLLHTLQALIYVAVVILARRNSAWAFGAGVTISVVWNSLNLFVTHLMQAGAIAIWSFLKTGQVQRLDTMMVTVGGIGHFILVAACLAAFLQLGTDSVKWRKFVGGGVVTLAYFALIVAIARPR